VIAVALKILPDLHACNCSPTRDIHLIGV
jgi:hypothetical protein